MSKTIVIRKSTREKLREAEEKLDEAYKTIAELEARLSKCYSYNKDYMANYYLKNREKILARQNSYYLKNREKILARQNSYYQNKKKRILSNEQQKTLGDSGNGSPPTTPDTCCSETQI